MIDIDRAGALMRDYRAKARLTQEQFAELIGISFKHYSQIERGSNGMSIKTMVKICDALGLTPDQLLGYAKPEAASEFAPVLAAIKRCNPQQREYVLKLIVSFLGEGESAE